MLKKELKLIYKNTELKVFNKYKKIFTKVFILEILVSVFNIYINY